VLQRGGLRNDKLIYTKPEEVGMSLHSYTRCWLHLIWGTIRREKLIMGESQKKVSQFLYDYAKEKRIYMKINHVNPDHVHALIDLPTNYAIEEIFQMLKGGSSHWINQENIVPAKFAWGRGYAAFSVSHSRLPVVVRYIANQEEHHRKLSFREEYAHFIQAHGLMVLKED